MRCWSSPGCCARICVDHRGSCCSRASRSARVAPSASSRSMRSSWPCRPSRSCSAPMSITARGEPAALTVPAMRSRCGWPLYSQVMGAPCALSAVRPRACSAAALTKTASGANRSRRSPPSNRRGSSAGATAASLSVSPPTRRSGTPAAAPSVRRAWLPPAAGAEAAPPGCSSTEASSQGTASAAWGWRATSAYRFSGRLPCMACSCRSGCPPTLRTARANSSSADWLMT